MSEATSSLMVTYDGKECECTHLPYGIARAPRKHEKSTNGGQQQKQQHGVARPDTQAGGTGPARVPADQERQDAQPTCAPREHRALQLADGGDDDNEGL